MNTTTDVTAVEAIRALAQDWTGQAPLSSRTVGRSALCRLFARLGFTEGAEIGVWTGLFSRELCEAVPNLHLRCVDPWVPQAEYRESKNDPMRLSAAYAQACERLRPFNCDLLQMTSSEAVDLVPARSLDFVYIDGNHRRAFVESDLAAWTARIRSGGVLAGHDFLTLPTRPFTEVEPAVREFTRARAIDPWFVLAGDRDPSYCWVVS